MVMKRSFRPEKVRHLFSVRQGDCLPIQADGTILQLPMPYLYRFSPESMGMIRTAEVRGKCEELRSLLKKLELCECTDRREEIQVLMEILRDLREQGDAGEGEWLQKRILWLLRKFAHRKYRDRFEGTIEELKIFGRSDPVRFATLIRGLEEVAALARARFSG
jgi:hypothetical protein